MAGPYLMCFLTWELVRLFFNAERPVREYERVRDVISSRGHDAGFFLVKMTEWPTLLRPEHTPSYSATLGGWVSIQSEPRKWMKKWLELREHALFTASSESVRDLANAGKTRHTLVLHGRRRSLPH